MDTLAQRLENMTPLQRAVFALKETRARLETLERQRSEPIAIVGMACRFPGGACDAASFWRLLCDGVDAIGEIPPDRWDVEAFYDPDPSAPGKTNLRCGGFLERIDEFDNHFFGISDREAIHIDPQQRMLLELSWEALEDAGLPPSTMRGSRTGVFLGLSTSEYAILMTGDPSQSDGFSAAGTALCLAANRLSFTFGLKGPSLILDTACSSSLVAAHLACQSIRSGQCDAALVGGASLLLSPYASINVTKAGFSSADGRIRAFDAAASGYVRSEGAGIVVLKPLSAALANNDLIYAVIRGSAINQNGVSNGLLAPSRAGQEEVLREAYASAGISPGKVQYVETQGTGTRLGDAIEALALGSVLNEGRAEGSRCAIGSAKTNVGHLEAASGMVSLMKTALALTHRQVPPSLHFQTPNPDIPFAELPIEVQRHLAPWPETTGPRLAGVSALGFGGSNAHLVLEEAPATSLEPNPQDSSGIAKDPDRGRYLLPLSARSEKGLRDLAGRYAEFLRNDRATWRDVCFTAAQRRDHHDCRLAVLADSRQQAIDWLAAFFNGEARPGGFTGRKPFGRDLKIAWVYDGRIVSPLLSGEGPGVRATARGSLLHNFRVVFSSFSANPTAGIAEIQAAFERVSGTTIEAALQAMCGGNQTPVAEPTICAVELILAAWWRDVGVIPEVVLGRGVGELAAACAANILTPDEALQIAASSNDRGAPVLAANRPASLPFVSSVDGRQHRGPDLPATHWAASLQAASGWTAALAAIAQRQVDFVLEIDSASLGNPSLANQGDLLGVVGALYAAGADIAWKRVAPPDGRPVRLPTTCWQRQKLWAPRSKPTVQASVASPRATPNGNASHSEATTAEDTAFASRATDPQSRPDLTVPYVPPRTDLETTLAESWSSLLLIDRIGIHDNFFELGGDSLQATILLNRLRTELGVALSAEVLFRVQSIAELAGFLQEHHAEAIGRQSKSAGELALDAHDRQTGNGNGDGNGSFSHRADGDAVIPRLIRDDEAEAILSRMDQLTDDEVKSLLRQAGAEREVAHE